MRRLSANHGRCPHCTLSAQPVFPEGAVGGLLAVGEAPGAREIAQGHGFAGPAGRNLDALLAAIGLQRQDYARTNMVWCRPPDNRKPSPGEIHACAPNVAAAIAWHQPRVLLAVGATPAVALCGDRLALGSFLAALDALYTQVEGEGLAHLPQHQGIPVVPMPHSSPLAWNRKAPNGLPIRAYGVRAAQLVRQLLRPLRAD